MTWRRTLDVGIYPDIVKLFLILERVEAAGDIDPESSVSRVIDNEIRELSLIEEGDIHD